MKKYSDYFEIDSGYYPEINPSSIKDPKTRWEKTFPHKTFVGLLEDTQRMLAREDNTRKKGIWIEGAYGTGKSRVAWTLKNLLDCPEEDFNAYFDAYGTLKTKHDLRTKLLASKRGRIITAYRYGSGLTSIQDFVVAVFDSVTDALEKAGLDPRGDTTIRGRIAVWLSDTENRQVFEIYAERPEHRGRGSLAGKSVDDILAQLNNHDQDASGLISDILAVGKASGISMFKLDMDDLTAWITEVIEVNKITSLVFVWDEFSSFFKNNRTSLDEFQKLAELSNEKPFYLVIVTHMAGLLGSEGDQAFKIVRDRFTHCSIEMPDSVAFDLIGHALTVKSAGLDEWEEFSDDLNSRMPAAREAVLAEVKDISDDETLRRLLPLHPMAALLLKHISTTFASNQRSMFNFINSADADNLQAFQWFIKTHGPEDENPILTIDFLWNFFYEKGTDEYTSQSGRSNLDFIVAATLDTYPSHEQELNTEERRVLKAILMMQAISQKLNNSVAVLRPTEKNINLAFQGDSSLEQGRAVSIANNVLVKQRKILYINPTVDGDEFAASAVSGDQVQIDGFKEKLAGTATRRLIDDAKFQDAVEGGLTVALRTRFKMTTATVEDVRKVANSAADADSDYHLQAVLCFARNDDEQVRLRNFIRDEASKERYRGIVFIDMSDNMLGTERFGEWATFSANEQYWRNKDANQADNQKRNADQILNSWKASVAQGPFEVVRGGERQRCANIEALKSVLGDAVLARFPLAFDHARVSENLFSQNAFKKGAQLGIQGAFGGIYQESSIRALLGDALCTERYWENVPCRTKSIGKLKQQLDEFIAERIGCDGRVSFTDMYNFLVERGSMPCNLHAYLMGFLLREYTNGSYRFGVGETGEDGGVMSPEKLAEFVDECIKNCGVRPIPRYREKYLEIMTPGQKRFVDFAQKAFDMPEGLSAEQAALHIRAFFAGDFGCPVWCLKKAQDAEGLGGLIDALAAIANPRSGENVPALSERIGKLLDDAPTDAQSRLAALMSRESGLDALGRYLEDFEDGELPRLAAVIGVANVVDDVRAQIGAGDRAWLWDRNVAEEELRKLIVDYRIVECTNAIEGMDKSHSFGVCMGAWKSFASFTHMPSHDLRVHIPGLNEIIRRVEEIMRDGELPYEKRAGFLEELERRRDEFSDFLRRRADVFAEIYGNLVEGLNQGEVGDLYSHLPTSSFTDDPSAFAQTVNREAERVRAGQRRHQLHELWETAAHVRDGHEWSKNRKTPILALVPDAEYGAARRLFETLHSTNPGDADVDASIEYLQRSPSFMESLGDQRAADEAFARVVLGRYAVVLGDLDVVRRRLCEEVTDDVYCWHGDARVSGKVKEMAKRSYQLGESSKAADFIDAMDEASAKKFLKRLAMADLEVGISVMDEMEAQA